MRPDYDNHGDVYVEEVIYKIEEFQSTWNRWMPIENTVYLSAYAHGEHSGCGKCWNRTGQYGVFDLEYANTYCNDLNKALKDGRILPGTANLTGFRVAKWENTYRKTIIEPENNLTIVVIPKENLIGADRFGECISCGSTEEIFKVEFCSEESTQRHSIRLCDKCKRLLGAKLLKGGANG